MGIPPTAAGGYRSRGELGWGGNLGNLPVLLLLFERQFVYVVLPVFTCLYLTNPLGGFVLDLVGRLRVAWTWLGNFSVTFRRHVVRVLKGSFHR